MKTVSDAKGERDSVINDKRPEPQTRKCPLDIAVIVATTLIDAL